jgi:hypothetical protein
MALRIVKFSPKEFNSFKDFQDFFNSNKENCLNYPERNGRFNFNGKINIDNFSAGDHLIFTWQAYAYYYAIALSNVLKNKDQYAKTLPKSIVLNLDSLIKLKTSVSLQEITNCTGCILKGRPWNNITDQYEINMILNSVCKIHEGTKVIVR